MESDEYTRLKAMVDAQWERISVLEHTVRELAQGHMNIALQHRNIVFAHETCSAICSRVAGPSSEAP